MKKSPEVLIIIPAYNEEKNIGSVLESIHNLNISDNLDVLVIDDCSKDNTAGIVKDYGYNVVRHIYNLGYGCGLQTGYRYAVKNNYSYVIQMDADGQHDVCNIEKIYRELTTMDSDGRCPDIVLGSRFLKDSPKYQSSFAKDMAYTLFRAMIKIGTGKEIKDPTTGLQGLSKRAFTYYAGYNHFDDKYPDANMITQMLMLGFKVNEIPALMHVRTEGVSMHSGLKPFVYMFRMTYSIIAVGLRIKLFRIGLEGQNA